MYFVFAFVCLCVFRNWEPNEAAGIIRSPKRYSKGRKTRVFCKLAKLKARNVSKRLPSTAVSHTTSAVRLNNRLTPPFDASKFYFQK